MMCHGGLERFARHFRLAYSMDRVVGIIQEVDSASLFADEFARRWTEIHIFNAGALFIGYSESENSPRTPLGAELAVARYGGDMLFKRAQEPPRHQRLLSL